MTAPLLSLPASDLHVWMVAQDAITDAETLAAYDALMTPDEREIQRRFVQARHRHEYLVTRALVRCVLSRYVGAAPAAWRFVRNAYGRPYVDWKASGFDAAPIPLLFNLSNTNGLIVIGVSSRFELGVDVEPLDRHQQILEIAHTVFAEPELTSLHALSPDAKRRRAVDYWTLKEAYIKARGMGLSIPLEQFWYTVADPIRIGFDPRLGDEPTKWQFGQIEPNGVHLVSWAVERGPHADVRASGRWIVPLREERAV